MKTLDIVRLRSQEAEEKEPGKVASGCKWFGWGKHSSELASVASGAQEGAIQAQLRAIPANIGRFTELQLQRVFFTIVAREGWPGVGPDPQVFSATRGVWVRPPLARMTPVARVGLQVTRKRRAQWNTLLGRRCTSQKILCPFDHRHVTHQDPTIRLAKPPHYRQLTTPTTPTTMPTPLPRLRFFRA